MARRADDGHGVCAWLTDGVVGFGVTKCCLVAPLCCTSARAPRAWGYTKLTTWHLQNPGCCAPCLEGCMYWVDMAYDWNPGDTRQLYYSRREQFGGSFCTHGKVCIADSASVCERLLQPMARGPYLGASNMRADKLPKGARGQELFPLALANGDVPGQDGRHAAFRAQLGRYIFNAECTKRAARTNVTSGALLARVASAYREAAAKGTEEALDEMTRGPLADFVLRYLHWALLGLDLGDESSHEYGAVRRAFFEPSARASSGLLYWLWGGELTSFALRWVPGLATALGARRRRNPAAGLLKPLQAHTPDALVERDCAAVRAIYARTAALSAYALDSALPNCPSKDEFISQLLVVVTIAGLQGPLTLLTSLVNKDDVYRSAGEWHPTKGIPRDFPLPLKDREKLRLVVLEMARLYPPVNGSAFVAHERVEVARFAGGAAARSFPKGCPFTLSYVCSNTDPSAWGPEPLKFDPYGHAPKLWGPNAIFNGFNSVGDHGERICPGRALALEMAIDFLQAIHAQK